MARDISTPIANLKKYFESCPNTRIHYLYFTCVHNKCTPHIKDLFREWSVNRKPIYSIYVPNGWCYNYGISAIKKLLYVDNHGVISFENLPTGAPIHDTNTNTNATIQKTFLKPVMTTLGDHITVGISESRNPQDFLIDTHKTYYVQRNTPTIQYKRKSIDCDFHLYSQAIDSETKCDSSTKNIEAQYIDEPFAIPIIQKITNVYKGTISGGKPKQKKKQHIYKGVSYEIQNGPRKGQFIQLRNRRKYIGGSLKLTYKGTGFDDGFIDFLHKYIFSVVALQQPGMEGITIIYDEESHIDKDSNKYICIIYDYVIMEEEERASIYYIDALKAFTAYYTYITSEEQRTIYEKRCLYEFNSEMIQHIPQVVVV